MLGELLNVINRFFILFNLKIVNPYLLSFLGGITSNKSFINGF